MLFLLGPLPRTDRTLRQLSGQACQSAISSCRVPPFAAVSLLSFLFLTVNKKTAADLRASRIDNIRVGRRGLHQSKLVFDHLDRAVSDEGSQHCDEDCGHALLSRVNGLRFQHPGMKNADDRKYLSCREIFLSNVAAGCKTFVQWKTSSGCIKLPLKA